MQQTSHIHYYQGRRAPQLRQLSVPPPWRFTDSTPLTFFDTLTEEKKDWLVGNCGSKVAEIVLSQVAPTEEQVTAAGNLEFVCSYSWKNLPPEWLHTPTIYVPGAPGVYR
jgi:hypothetical protein